jgi:hypothetical protein
MGEIGMEIIFPISFAKNIVKDFFIKEKFSFSFYLLFNIREGLFKEGFSFFFKFEKVGVVVIF